jgi:hypothetical protein
MNRQQALAVIWQRLLIILLGMLAIITLIVNFGGHFRVGPLVFLIGNVGGYVSAQRSLASLTDNEVIGLASSWLGLIVPPLVGGILGLVLYILFLSKLIAGDVFPTFVPDANAPRDFSALINQHAEDMKDYAKLCFWAFVAGFNQNYAVDLINAVRNK